MTEPATVHRVQARDFNGDLIKPGCRILYPVGKGDGLAEAEVLRIEYTRHERNTIRGLEIHDVPSLVIYRLRETHRHGDAAQPANPARPSKIGLIGRGNLTGNFGRVYITHNPHTDQPA